MARRRQAYSLTRLADPVPDSEFGRIDQGVDYLSKAPVRAVASGTIISHDDGMAGGTGDIIRQRFDKPVRVRGNRYFGAYYSEEKPLVKVGQRVRSGQKVMSPGSNEVGFLVGPDLAMPPLIGGLGAGTQPTPAGEDFDYTVASLGGPHSSRVRGGGSVTVAPGGPMPTVARSHGAATADSGYNDNQGSALVDRWHSGSGGFLDSVLSGVPVLGPIIDSVDSVTGFLKLAVWLIDPFNWLRLFEMLIGGIFLFLSLIGLGVLLASRSDTVKEAAGVAQLAPGPVGAAGRAVTVAGRARSSSQERRRLVAERVPQAHAEKAATQQGEREERQSQRRKKLADARASGRRRVQAARTRTSADERFGKVPF